MRIVQVHNRHLLRGGEEVMYEETCRLLAERGHEVVPFERSNGAIRGPAMKVRAFADGIYSRSSRRAFERLLAARRPDIVDVHNVYALISPSVLVACRQRGVPVVLRCADYRVVSCPVATHLRAGSLCERCSGGREYWCLLHNCRGSLLQSGAYALRSLVARKARLFLDNVTCFLPVTHFFRRRMLAAGFPAERLVVLPNVVPVPQEPADPAAGTYAAYVGRISPEKGIRTLLQSVRQARLPLRLAGDWTPMPAVARTPPDGVRFLGQQSREQLAALYRGARFTVVPSEWHEPFGLVAAEAMSHGLPVIAARSGGLPEVVEDGVSGLLFEPGNAAELAQKMDALWRDPARCRQLGQAGRRRVLEEYSPERYYERLLAVYRRAMAAGERAPTGAAGPLARPAPEPACLPGER
ncbi:MAG: glycosyltransferase family 4 protein [Candidatus Latescibacterota bacterium]